jgi:Mn2+/Fe2+ NRAMP family transporter
MVLFGFPAIVMNIGADLAGMGAEGSRLLSSIQASYFSIVFAFLLLGLIIYLPYKKITSALKYFCNVVMVWLSVSVLYKQDWLETLKGTFIATVKFDKNFIRIPVGITGTTIPPIVSTGRQP